MGRCQATERAEIATYASTTPECAAVEKRAAAGVCAAAIPGAGWVLVGGKGPLPRIRARGKRLFAVGQSLGHNILKAFFGFFGFFVYSSDSSCSITFSSTDERRLFDNSGHYPEPRRSSTFLLFAGADEVENVRD